MLRLVVLLFLAALVVFVALSAWLVAKIGWIAVPIMFVAAVVAMVGCLVLVKRNAGRIAEGVLKQPFKMKGAVLRGADVSIHSVAPAPDPPVNVPTPDEDTEDLPKASVPQRRYWIDATIVPSERSQTPFGAWEPGELALAPPDADPDEVDDDQGGDVVHVEVESDGTFARWEGEKYAGARRVRLLASVPATMREARFRYYFEEFGNVAFPVAEP